MQSKDNNTRNKIWEMFFRISADHSSRVIVRIDQCFPSTHVKRIITSHRGTNRLKKNTSVGRQINLSLSFVAIAATETIHLFFHLSSYHGPWDQIRPGDRRTERRIWGTDSIPSVIGCLFFKMFSVFRSRFFNADTNYIHSNFVMSQRYTRNLMVYHAKQILKDLRQNTQIIQNKWMLQTNNLHHKHSHKYIYTNYGQVLKLTKCKYQ